MLFKRPTNRLRRANFRRSNQARIESLETRRLMAATVTATIPAVLAHPGLPTTDNLDLSTFFNDPNILGTTVTLTTTAGPITVTLTDNATPQSVADFLAYVNSGAYNNTFFHRAVVLATGAGGSPTSPSDIVQGGGYFVTSQNGISHITTNAAVPDEYTQELFGDVAGTIALAKTSEANSATSEFFFNVHDNTSALDTPTQDDNGVTTSYTAFGKVIGNGMTVVDTLAALATADISGANSALTTVPVTGDTSSVTASSLEYVNSAKVVPGISYTVTSDNPLVVPTVTGNTLSFTYGAGATGVANITISAASADGVSTATQTFALTVPNTAAPTQGPTAVADVAPDILHDTTGIFHPLLNDTDSLSPLKPSSVVVTTAPTHGTATVDPTTGNITYVPAAGYIGADSLQYTVSDAAGSTSAPGTMTINVTPDPKQITIGTAGNSDLTYTQPDGTVAHLIITGGSAVITFHNYNVNVTNSGAHVIASGPGTTIANITVTNNSKSLASLSLTTKSGTPTVGGITDAAGGFSQINAPTTNLTGDINIGGCGRMIFGSTTDANIQVGFIGFLKFVSINTATNTNLSQTSGIMAIKCNQWLDPAGGHSITSAELGSLTVSGEFDEGISLSRSSALPIAANIGQLGGGTWQITGLIRSISAKTVDPSWSVSTDNLILALKFGGDFASRIQAGAINSMTVGGSIKNAVIETDAGWTAKFIQLNKLHVGGSISNSEIVAEGNIGTVTATGMTDSAILAGLDSTIIQGTALPTSHTDFTSPLARIQSVQLGTKGTFSNSRVAAGAIGSLQLGNVTTSNNSTPFGAAGATIGSVNAVLDSKTKLVLGKAQLATGFALATYIADKKLTLTDFQMDLIT